MVDLSDSILAEYFVLWQGNWKCKQKTTDGIFAPEHHSIRGNILAFYRTVGNTGANGLTILGLPVEDDHPVCDGAGKAYSNVVEQRFERGIVRYDPEHLLDNPPGSGACYLVRVHDLYSAPQKMQTLTQEVAQQNIEKMALEDELQAVKTQLHEIKAATKQISSLDIPALVHQISQELTVRIRQSIGAEPATRSEPPGQSTPTQETGDGEAEASLSS